MKQENYFPRFLICIFIFLMGLLVSSWVGDFFLIVGKWFIKKMPLVKHIYSVSKKISATISLDIPEIRHHILGLLKTCYLHVKLYNSLLIGTCACLHLTLRIISMMWSFAFLLGFSTFTFQKHVLLYNQVSGLGNARSLTLRKYFFL